MWRSHRGRTRLYYITFCCECFDFSKFKDVLSYVIVIIAIGLPVYKFIYIYCCV